MPIEVRKLLLRIRYPLMFLALAFLVLAGWIGLLRMGWDLPTLGIGGLMAHGPLMIGGFLGTLIIIERAVAFDHPLAYFPAVLTALGSLLIAVGSQGAGLITLGSLGLGFIFIFILRQHPARHTAVMALGALLWVAGNVLWLTEHPLSTLALWWAVFLIVTIAGERLELGRMIPQGRISSFIYFAGISILLMGLLATLFRYGLAVRVIAVGLLFLAFWLFRYDLASRTIRSKGVTRYIAACMLLGYFELSVAGLIGLFYGGVRVGPIYDAFLHSMFLGFVVSMIFGHAPIIFPGVTGRQIRYHPAFYIHLVLLHLSLLLRVGSDLSSWHIGRQWGAMLNAIALLVFLGNTFFGMRGQRAQQQAGSLTS